MDILERWCNQTPRRAHSICMGLRTTTFAILCLSLSCASGPVRPATTVARDRDSLGPVDTVDKCPENAKEAAVAPKDTGCPEIDTHGDDHFVADVDDKCPAIRDCDSDFMDDDGCPDFVIMFAKNSSAMNKKTTSLVEEVAKELLERNKVAVLRVDAHVIAGEPIQLAIDRAAAVIQTLVRRGVPAKMLTKKTYRSKTSASGFVSFFAEKCR